MHHYNLIRSIYTAYCHEHFSQVQPMQPGQVQSCSHNTDLLWFFYPMESLPDSPGQMLLSHACTPGVFRTPLILLLSLSDNQPDLLLTVVSSHQYRCPGLLSIRNTDIYQNTAPLFSIYFCQKNQMQDLTYALYHQ